MPLSSLMRECERVCPKVSVEQKKERGNSWSALMCCAPLIEREKREKKEGEKREREHKRESIKECERAISVKLAKMNPPSTRDNTPQRRLDELKGQKRDNKIPTLPGSFTTRFPGLPGIPSVKTRVFFSSSSSLERASLGLAIPRMRHYAFALL